MAHTATGNGGDARSTGSIAIAARHDSSAMEALGRDPERSIFVSHASEDKDAIARPLAHELRRRGFGVWFDEFSLVVGDNLRREIDRGLALARFGVVIVSASFFKKEWPQRELDALMTRETADGADLILPVWHEIDFTTVVQHSPTLANRVAVMSSRGVQAVADHITQAVHRVLAPAAPASGDAVNPPPSVMKGSPSRSFPASRSRRSDFAWHPDVHRRWGRTRLHFIQLAADPQTSPELLFSRVRECAERHRVGTWTYDELFGAHDAMVRIWLPEGVAAAEFVATLSRGPVDRHDLIMGATIFEVTEILRHWMWQSRDGRHLRQPAEAVLAGDPSVAEVQAIDRGEATSAALAQYLREGLIAPVETAEGIGFYITVSIPETRDTTVLRNQLTDVITSTIDDATGVDAPALYRGRSRGQLLVTGRIAHVEFPHARAALFAPVAERAADLGARTLTTIGPGEHPAYYAEALYAGPPPA